MVGTDRSLPDFYSQLKAERREEFEMTVVFIAPRPKGKPEGSAVDDYVIEDHADHILASFKTQQEAIDWAKKDGHTVHVARVRHLSDKRIPDHWRAA